jgi:N-acylglucosamine 2-epimerase
MDIASQWRARLERDLWGSVMPFWANHSGDAAHGGFFNCLDEDGVVYDTTKHIWLQGRQCWMYARLCSEYSDAAFSALVAAHPGPLPSAAAAGGPASPAPLTRASLLAQAERGVDFLLRHAVASDGQSVYFAVTREGVPALAQRKPFSAAFLILALGELAVATGKPAYRAQALQWLDKYFAWCNAPGGSGAALGKPGLPGAPALLPLNEPMIALNLIMELCRGLPREEALGFYAGERERAVAAVLAHASMEHRAVFEGMPASGVPDLSTPAGRLLNPGHAIEAGWFLLDVAAFVGDAALRGRALEIIDWAWEGGWDGELARGTQSPAAAGLGKPAREAAAGGAGQGAGGGSGGMVYFRDACGFSPTQLEAHSKLWWPQAEAMVAFSKAYAATGREDYLQKFDAVATWTYEHLVTDKEWYGYCDRTGAVTHRVRLLCCCVCARARVLRLCFFFFF